MRQVLPAERSTNTAVDPFRSEYPTAVHAAADVHATPIRKPSPAWLGVAWMRHRVPFHRSAKVTALGVKPFEAPTAVHDVADVQDTPFRVPPPCDGLGMA